MTVAARALAISTLAWVLAGGGPLPPARERAAGAASLRDVIRRRDLTLLAALLEHPQAPTWIRTAGPAGVTALHVAAALNQEDACAMLLARGAPVQARTEAGFTPLHWAAARDAESAARVLLEYGANPNIDTPHGVTPLHWAAANNATNVVRLLLNASARYDATTDGGHTALHWAVLRRAHEASVLLAYRIVSDEMDRDAAGGWAPPRPERSEASAHTEVPSVHADNVGGWRVAPGSDLLIALAPGVTLDFVWLEGLGIWMARYETSNAQFRRFCPTHHVPSRGEWELDAEDQPCAAVTWYQAAAFCEWLTERYGYRIPAGYRFDLPTVEEWQAAAQCGMQRRYPWGDAWPPTTGNYRDRSAASLWPEGPVIETYADGFPAACPVALAGTNAWGLVGMGGNVWEWSRDWSDETRRYKVRLGAAWDCGDEPSLRIEMRGFDRPDVADDTVGFRVVVVPEDRLENFSPPNRPPSADDSFAEPRISFPKQQIP